MRLIDADAAYERAQVDSRRGALEDWEFDMIVNLLDSAPTVDAAPVVHGRWIEESGTQICSNCGEEHEWDSYRASYCDCCGAKMDGGDPNGR
jgi:transposase